MFEMLKKYELKIDDFKKLKKYAKNKYKVSQRHLIF